MNKTEIEIKTETEKYFVDCIGWCNNIKIKI